MAINRIRPDDLRQAIEHDTLSLHFQPQVEARTGRLVGVEGFVRWPHAALGMVGPSDITALVQAGGLHAQFDRWVVRAACAQAVRWRREKVEVPLVAANVWAATLQGPEIADVVSAALSDSGAEPSVLELECPREASTDPALAKALASIRALGVRLATDEYANAERSGGGLRFDTLKIPFAIVRGLGAGSASSADIVREVVATAKRSAARVVAEGVETAAQEDALTALGCEIVQGYLYGPEVAPGELRSLLGRAEE